MADLQQCRVQQCHAFSIVDIHYAAPLTMRETSLRKSRQRKVYISVFVCRESDISAWLFRSEDIISALEISERQSIFYIHDLYVC
ncbi:Integrase catalytic domain-containing protein [Aphis craccivora]|uniref:Integrase catalytic domain-containing protein n=1 Tax=Aphis craccivora TaxID=307492 RepID=A0A6G0YU05_APHCR|nr:Integrase catalytic domain-containing protein [Aphis craccivora]